MKNIMEEVRKFLRTYPPLAEGKLDDKISKIIEQEAEDVVLGLKS